jgi:diaminopimelate decarboxylase
MTTFSYKDDNLFCESVDLTRVADTEGTPLYVYSLSGVLSALHRFGHSFADYPHKLCFALKANSNPVLLKTLAEQGVGADVVSGGELQLALNAGFPPEKIAYAGVGKTDSEIEFAVRSRIMALNIESMQELEVTAAIAERLKIVTPVAIRVNPDIDIEGHPYLTTGKSANKFGIPFSEVREAFIWAAAQPYLRPVGIHSHIGSNIAKIDPWIKNAKTLTDFIIHLKADGIELEHIDLGGGFGVDYDTVLAEQGNPLLLDPEAVIPKLIDIIKKSGCECILEPGRSIIGPHGVLLTRVLFTKQSRGKRFVVVDAGMNDLLRPSLYNAHHEILPLQYRNDKREKADIVGPVCETGDFLGLNRSLPPLQRGDLLAVMTAGAYGYTLASNYNTRPRPAEVLVEENRYRLVRKREKL